MASLTQATSCGSQSKSGKPWPRLTAFFSVANADMTVKMVVPMLGNLVSRCGVVITGLKVESQWGGRRGPGWLW